MKLTGIILLATSAAIGADAQVLKGTSSSYIPRLRKNVMKEADRRRLQETIDCTGIEYGLGLGCVEQADSAGCISDTQCLANNDGYNACFIGGTNTCVCLIPGTKCKEDFGGTEKPCCYEG